MRITLRNVQHLKSLSDETEAFSATVYIDDVKAGTVSNRGCGGSHEYYPAELERRLSEYAKSQPRVVCDEMRDPSDASKPFTYEADADHFIDRAFTRWMHEQDVKRLLRSGVAFTKKGQQGLFTLKRRMGIAVADDAARVAASPEAMAKFGIDKILNLIPFEDAVSIYEAQAALEGT